MLVVAKSSDLPVREVGRRLEVCVGDDLHSVGVGEVAVQKFRVVTDIYFSDSRESLHVGDGVDAAADSPLRRADEREV